MRTSHVQWGFKNVYRILNIVDNAGVDGVQSGMLRPIESSDV
jgi:hypothetical protein